MKNYDTDFEHYEMIFHNKQSNYKQIKHFYGFLSLHRMTCDLGVHCTRAGKSIIINILREL